MIASHSSAVLHSMYLLQRQIGARLAHLKGPRSSKNNQTLTCKPEQLFWQVQHAKYVASLPS